MADVFTRFTEVSIIFDITSKTLQKIIEAQWIKKHGDPLDSSPTKKRQYISNGFASLMKQYNIIRR